MPFLSNNQRQRVKGKKVSHSMDVLTPKFTCASSDHCASVYVRNKAQKRKKSRFWILKKNVNKRKKT